MKVAVAAEYIFIKAVCDYPKDEGTQFPACLSGGCWCRRKGVCISHGLIYLSKENKAIARGMDSAEPVGLWWNFMAVKIKIQHQGMHRLGPNRIHLSFGTTFRAKVCNLSGTRRRLSHHPPDRVQTIRKPAQMPWCLSFPMPPAVLMGIHMRWHPSAHGGDFSH